VSWARRFRIRQGLKSSLWVAPLVGLFLGLALSYGMVGLEDVSRVPHGWTYSPGTALTVLTTIVAATVGLVGFVVTVTVLCVQMAANTFSARYMRIWYRDPLLKATLAVLIGAVSFSFSLLRRINTSVPNLAVTVSGVLVGVGLVLFVVFLDRVLHRLRPVAVAALVARAGRRSLRSIAPAAGRGRMSEPPPHVDLDAVLVVRSRRSGAIQAIEKQALARWAAEHDAVLVLDKAVGDFASTGSRLAVVHAAAPVDPAAEDRILSLVALGSERTIDQDPAFAIRIMVDVAIRALSPAVNDPTTAVQVLNHLEDLLGTIGTTPGLDGLLGLEDADGRLRVLVPSHRWEDFLALAVTEIREYGGRSLQVVRRLRALLDTLEEGVLPEYLPAVQDERARLEATIAGAFGDTVDRDRAVESDRQGIGGPSAVAS
jgi:uncharacterized membrane protein